MNKNFKPETDERTTMIIAGILILYFLIAGFVLYLLFMHRLTIVQTIISDLILTIIYIPRFIIIKKLLNKDEIKIVDDGILINREKVEFARIKDFKIKEAKPRVIFFINNKMIIFQEAQFCLLIDGQNNGYSGQKQISFTAIGTEKIHLLKEFLTNITM